MQEGVNLLSLKLFGGSNLSYSTLKCVDEVTGLTLNTQFNTHLHVKDYVPVYINVAITCFKF